MNDFDDRKQALLNAQERCASWFLCIAGMTLVNTFLTLYTKSGFGFAVSLGVVHFANYLLASKIAALGFSVLMAAVFAGFGWFARSGNIPVYTVGMVLYGLDGLILLLDKDWISIAVHAYIIYQLYTGVQHAGALKKLIAEEEADLRQQRIYNANAGQP